MDLDAVTSFAVTDPPTVWELLWEAREIGVGRQGDVLWDWFTTKLSTIDGLTADIGTGAAGTTELEGKEGAFPANNIIA